MADSLIFKQFESKGLAHYSYVVGSKAEGAIIVIDPERDISTYLKFAAENRVVIKHVIETHIHADYASGARELEEKLGAHVWESAYDVEEKYQVQFPHHDLKDGDSVEIGDYRLQAVHTPGHTPEHMSYLLFEKSKSEHGPTMFFTGDFLFIGSVGRPDLLGESSKDGLARRMYASVQTKLKGLPDNLIIYPAHGAGSLCGSGLHAGTSSTLGTEKLTNPYLQPMTEDEFVHKLLSNTPPTPDYYFLMKDLNSVGAEASGLDKPLPEITVEELAKRIGEGEMLIDVRDALSFGGAHIPGSLNLAMRDHIGAWGAWYLDRNAGYNILGPDADTVAYARQQLARVGIDHIKGYLAGGLSAWAGAGQEYLDLPQASVHTLQDFIDLGEAPYIIDVRSAEEFAEGHIPQSKHLYLGTLPKSLAAIPEDKEAPIFCVCGGGSRSSIAASFLMSKGYENVYSVYGGVTAWKAANMTISKPKAEKPVAPTAV